MPAEGPPRIRPDRDPHASHSIPSKSQATGKGGARAPEVPRPEVRSEAGAEKAQGERMKLTPLDVKSQTFSTRWKGFDPAEVQAFLEVVTNDLEEIASENNALRDEAKRLRSDLEQHTDREKTLKETMVTAQRLADEIRQNADDRAKIAMSEAEVRAEKILDAAHRRAAKISEDISELKRQRMSLESAIRATIQSHLSMLDGLREDNKDQDELDEKLKFLLRKNG